MNKLTTTFAGLAIVAAASVAPAFAQTGSQGNFFTPGPFQFSFIGTPGTAGSSFFVNAIPVTENTLDTSGVKTGLLTLTGGKEMDGSPLYTGVTLTFVPNNGAPTVTDTFNYVALANTGAQGYGIANFGVGNSGSTFNLIQGQVTPAVPEASTVISFGALLALGGLAVLRRKSVAKNAA